MSEWRASGADVWQHQKRTSNGWYLNTTAVRLADGRSAIISPTARLSDVVHDELIAKIGEPAFLVAPNHYHWLGIPEWHERYGGARVVASPTAALRLRKNLKGKVSCETLEPLVGALPSSMDILVPKGTRNGEIWLRAEGGAGEVLWAVSDAWFNAPENPNGLFGLLCRIVGVSPGFRIGRTWLVVGLRDNAVYFDWVLQQLKNSPPTRLAVSHGETLDTPDIAAMLEEQVRQHL